MTRSFPVLCTALFMGSALVPMAQAQSVSDCDWRARADAVVEPWTDWTRTFANGNVRLAITDTIEPAAGAMHVVVMSPPYGPVGERRCQVISASGTTGFSGIFINGLLAGYDPSVGLMFDLPVQVYDGTLADYRNAMLSFTLNQSNGLLQAVLNPAD